MSRARKRGEKRGTQDKIEGAMDNIRGRIEEATGSVSGDRGETAERSSDRSRELQESYGGYKVYDRRQQEIGKVDELFVDENDQPEYIGVRTGLLGTKFTLIPMEIARVNERRGLIQVSADNDAVNDAPSFDEEELTAEHEDRIYRHFGLERAGSASERGGYGEYYPSDTPRERSPGYREADNTPREGRERSVEESEASGGRLRADEERPEPFAEDREEPRGRPEGPSRHVEGERAEPQDTRRNRPDMEPETGGTEEYRGHETREARKRRGTTGEDVEHEDTLVSRDEEDRRSGRNTGSEPDAGPSALGLETSDRRHGEDPERGGPRASHEPSSEEDRTDVRGTAGAFGGDREREEPAEHQPEAASGCSAAEREDVSETASRRSDGEPESGLREQKPGSMRVRKRVHTDQEQIRVPVNREEARLERGPDGELRIRKEVVEDEETIEVEVQREQADIDDGDPQR
jgi:uncharacterized protein YjbJ (UPF0337 family)